MATTITTIIGIMSVCLVSVLLIGLLFGYLYAKAKSREVYEDKIDALQELNEEKINQFESIKAKYKNLEITQNEMLFKYKACSDNLELSKEKAEQLQISNDKCTEKLDDADNIINHQQEEIKEQNKLLQESRERIEKLTADNTKCQESNDQLQAKVSEYSAQNNKIEKDLMQKEQYIAKATDTVLELKQKIDHIEQEKAQNEIKLQQMKVLTDERNRYLDKVDELSTACSNLEKEKLLLETKIQDLNTNIYKEKSDSEAENQFEKNISVKLGEIKQLLKSDLEVFSEDTKKEIFEDIEKMETNLKEKIEKKNILSIAKNILKKLKGNSKKG